MSGQPTPATPPETPTQTPRTDAAAISKNLIRSNKAPECAKFVPVETARQLERELAAARAEIQHLKDDAAAGIEPPHVVLGFARREREIQRLAEQLAGAMKVVEAAVEWEKQSPQTAENTRAVRNLWRAVSTFNAQKGAQE